MDYARREGGDPFTVDVVLTGHHESDVYVRVRTLTFQQYTDEGYGHFETSLDAAECELMGYYIHG